ncbi:MAG: response regulator, partial [Pirellula sp.]
MSLRTDNKVGSVEKTSSASSTDIPQALMLKPRPLLFGIKTQILAFILLLIGIGYLINLLKVQALSQYTVEREKIDLEDETENKKLSIELALEIAFGQVVELCNSKSSLKESIDLATRNREQAIQRAYLVSANALETLVDVEKSPFDPQKLKTYFKENSAEPLWSTPYWDDTDKSTLRPCIDVLIRQISTDANNEHLACRHIRFDLSPLATDLWRGSRQLVYVAGMGFQNDRSLAEPTLVTSIEKEFPIDRLSVINTEYVWIAPEEFVKPDYNRRVLGLPQAVRDAIDAFKTEKLRDARVARKGFLWAGGPSSSDGLELAKLYDPALFDKPFSPPSKIWYSESDELDATLMDQLVSDKFREDLKLRAASLCVSAIDPYIKIDRIVNKVKRIRLRASSQDSLQQAKNLIVTLIRGLDTPPNRSIAQVQLHWNDIAMDNFVLSVQQVDLPIGAAVRANNDMGPQLGYLVVASSLNEIRGAFGRDLHYLENLTWGAAAFAIASALLVSWWLISPLSRMTAISQKVAELSSNDSSSEELEALLCSMPTEHQTEIGVLSRQFDVTTRQLIRAKRKAEEDSSRIASKQREVEQAERERAVANEVSEHLVQLLGSVSHDMRQPLFEISGHADRLFKQTDLSDSHRERLKKILRGSSELNSLINDILDYKRFINGEIILEPSPFTLSSLLEEIAVQHEDAAEKRKVEIVTKLFWDGELCADRMRLKRVLNNLVSNSLNATNNGQVHLQVNPNGTEWVEIIVRDTGCGMNQAQMDLVFKFGDERARAIRRQGVIGSRKDANSTGLGLFISKQLIDCMGGSIDFVSHEGKGTTFTVRLPIKAASFPGNETSTIDFPHTELQSPLGLSGASADPSFAGRTAVVVDDDPKCTEILAEMLTEMGYTTQRVHDPEVAGRIIAQTHPDLVTLDIFMPNIDGWALLKQLKSNCATADIPVIMVTVHPDQAKATVLGADGFVGKPVEEASLHQAVSSAIGARRNACVLVVDDDEACLTEMQSLLRPLGCRVIVARDGVEALDRIRTLEINTRGEADIDLAIVDLFMPNMDGFGLIERLGAMSETRHVPIIVVSAGVLTPTEREELLPHVRKFFEKGSVELKTLQQEINRLL